MSNELFFQIMSNELKLLPDIALKYLSVPASSVESERTFSTAGRLTERRARLKDKNVNILVFMHKNRWIFDT